jgi:hypothetical protein
MRNVPRNLVAFLCYQALTGPLLVYALLSRGWKFAGVVAAVVTLGVGLSMVAGSANLVLYAVPAALGICFLPACAGVVGDLRGGAGGVRNWEGVDSTRRRGDAEEDAEEDKRKSREGRSGIRGFLGWRAEGAEAAEGNRALPTQGVPRRGSDGGALPLVVWLGSGLVALPYVYMGAKYLLPGVPAAALVIVLHTARVRQRRYPLTVALVVALGWISGALIVVGDSTLASSQRAAVNQLIAPRIRRGLTVWAGGQWAFLGYAEDAGAKALGNTPPLPGPGDTIVVSRLDYYGMLDRLPIRRELLHTRTDERCGVFVLNRRLKAGFFSNRFGYLPFAIGCGEVNAYDVYRVLP